MLMQFASRNGPTTLTVQSNSPTTIRPISCAHNMYSMLENLPDVLYDVYHRRLARILKAFHLSKHFISQSMAPVTDDTVGDVPLTQLLKDTTLSQLRLKVRFEHFHSPLSYIATLNDLCDLPCCTPLVSGPDAPRYNGQPDQ